jgi:zinc protease
MLRRRLLLAIAVALAPAAGEAQSATRGLNVPIDYYKLPNGLKVVLSRDTTAPTAVVAVYYNIGFRNEPKDRTGFAHLFEHMMFQGSVNLPKGEFTKLVQNEGGVFNGSTRFDFTNYFQVIPSHTIETVLWAEADRMRGLQIDSANLKNQQEVVKSEVRVNVLNQPYSTFPWIDLPMTANTNWYNAHNFYGDLAHLDAATLTDVAAFFRTFYAPNNAALVVTGDLDPAQTRAWIQKYFGPLPASPQPPKVDLTEPRQTEERRGERTDALANRPAVGIAYHMPDRHTPEWYAMGMLDQILGQGRDSWLYEELVRKTALTGGVSAGINWGLGNQFDYAGPMLWMLSYFHDNNKSSDSLVAATERVIARVREEPIDAATIARARTKIRSSLYSSVETFNGFGLANILASFALFDDDPALINRLEAGFAAVTPEVLQRTAREYLRPTNRTVYFVKPGRTGAGAGGER